LSLPFFAIGKGEGLTGSYSINFIITL